MWSSTFPDATKSRRIKHYFPLTTLTIITFHNTNECFHNSLTAALKLLCHLKLMGISVSCKQEVSGEVRKGCRNVFLLQIT